MVPVTSRPNLGGFVGGAIAPAATNGGTTFRRGSRTWDDQTLNSFTVLFGDADYRGEQKRHVLGTKRDATILPPPAGWSLRLGLGPVLTAR